MGNEVQSYFIIDRSSRACESGMEKSMEPERSTARRGRNVETCGLRSIRKSRPTPMTNESVLDRTVYTSATPTNSGYTASHVACFGSCSFFPTNLRYRYPGTPYGFAAGRGSDDMTSLHQHLSNPRRAKAYLCRFEFRGMRTQACFLTAT